MAEEDYTGVPPEYERKETPGFSALEGALRKTGNPNDIERADIIAAMLKARGEDIALYAQFSQPSTDLTEVAKNLNIEMTPSSTPVLLLRGAETDTLTFSQEKIAKAAIHNAELQEKLSGFVSSSPYYFTFFDRIPYQDTKVTSGRRFPLWKKGREKLTNGGTEPVEWTEYEKTRGISMEYMYRLYYDQTPSGNKMTEVKLLLGSQHDNSITWDNDFIPRISITFSGSDIASARISMRGINEFVRTPVPYALLELSRDTALGSFLEESFVLKPSINILNLVYEIKFGTSPCLSIYEHVIGGKLKSEYTWDEVESIFNHYVTNPEIHNRYGTTTKPTMDMPGFVDLAKSTLSLIPTIDAKSLINP